MEHRKYLDILQVYRGIAALAIVFAHTINSIVYFNGIEGSTLAKLGPYGKYGVDFFFVLSGFIIAYTNLGKSVKVKDYLLKRVTRIYVPYLPVSLAMVILFLFLPQISANDRDFNLLNSLTLFPIGKPALSVAWSLSYEMFFYLLFIVCILSRKLFHILAFVWSVLIFLSVGNVLKLHSFLFSFYILEFFIGYVLAYSIVFNRRFVYSGILILVMSINYFILPSPFSHITIAVFCSLLIFVSINFSNFRLPETNIFMVIGACSYSIYLIHNPLQSLLVRFFTFVPQDYVVGVVLSVVFVLSVVVAYIYYLIFEKWLTKHLYNKLK